MDQRKIINIQIYAYRLIPLDNSDLLIQLEAKILCLKSPNYSLNNILEINFPNTMIDGICAWKNNYIIIKTKQKLIVIELLNNNTNYRIVSEQVIFENMFLRYQKMISLNNFSKLLLNTMNGFIIMNEKEPYIFQLQYSFKYNYGFNSFIQIRKDELMCNSSEENKVFFIDLKIPKIITDIKDINIYTADIDTFCFVNNDIVALGGDLRDGIYLFDINSRTKIKHYKEDWVGFHSLLNIGNNKFIGEAYAGRCYGESDDENEELFCTMFFEYDSQNNEIRKYKTGEGRIYAERRSNYIKFKNENKIAYYSNKKVYVENL